MSCWIHRRDVGRVSKNCDSLVCTWPGERLGNNESLHTFRHTELLLSPKKDAEWLYIEVIMALIKKLLSFSATVVFLSKLISAYTSAIWEGCKRPSNFLQGFVADQNFDPIAILILHQTSTSQITLVPLHRPIQYVSNRVPRLLHRLRKPTRKLNWQCKRHPCMWLLWEGEWR